MDSIRFNTHFDFDYGVVKRLSPLVRRVVARNPGAYTFHGTSTFIVGNQRVAVIDPGPDLPDHVDNILAALPGETISHILVTHTHADHSPASRLLKQISGAPTYGFGRHGEGRSVTPTAGSDDEFVPDFALKNGDLVDGMGWHLEAIHTPGHCSNHLCFALPQESTLFCGDQVMAWSTTVILPPDGSVGEYLKSLETLRLRAETLYRPTHGTAIDSPHAYIDQIIAHRMARIEQVYAAVQSGIRTIAQIRQHVYAGLDSRLHGGAEKTIRGSLDFLIEKGRVREDSSAATGIRFDASE